MSTLRARSFGGVCDCCAYQGSYSGFQALNDDSDSWGCSFTGNGFPIANAVFLLERVGTFTGEVTATIWAHTGVFGISGIPTGDPLAVSDGLDVSSISQGGLNTLVFSEANQIILENGVHYVVTVHVSNADMGHYVLIFYHNSETTQGFPFHPGNMVCSYYAYPYWNAPLSWDLIFYINNTDPHCELYKDDTLLLDGTRGWNAVDLNSSLTLVDSDVWDTYGTPSLGDNFATWLQNIDINHYLLIGINGKIATPTTNLMTALSDMGVIFNKKFNCIFGNGQGDTYSKSMVFIAKILNASANIIYADDYDLQGNAVIDEQIVLNDFGSCKIKKSSSTQTLKVYDPLDVARIIGNAPLKIKTPSNIAAFPAAIGIGDAGLFVQKESSKLGIRSYLTSNKTTGESVNNSLGGSFDTTYYQYNLPPAPPSTSYKEYPWIFTTPITRCTRFEAQKKLNTGPTGWTWNLLIFTQNGWEFLPTNVNISSTGAYFDFNYDLDYERTIYKFCILPNVWHGASEWTFNVQISNEPILIDAYTTY